MKSILLVIIAFALGYGSYPFFNPKAPELSGELGDLFQKFLLEEAKIYAQTADPDEKLKAADKMYGRMTEIFDAELTLKAPENEPAKINITVKPEKKVVQEVPKTTVKPSVAQEPVSLDKDQSPAEKIHSNSLDVNTFLSFSNLPYLSGKDSRILKLVGHFEGPLKSSGPTRTGEEEKVVLEINQDKAKEKTKLEIIDSYDNVTLNILQMTDKSFKSVPGDENLLLMQTQTGSVIFDLRKYPLLTGKVLNRNKLTGEFELKRSGD